LGFACSTILVLNKKSFILSQTNNSCEIM
jgi:hypothetical protein